MTGHELTMSSIGTLRSQLGELARRLGADEADLARRREHGSGGAVVRTFEVGGDSVVEEREPGSLEEEGQFGLAVFLELAERAVEHRLPLKLDY